jgi:hypothetical protein
MDVILFDWPFLALAGGLLGWLVLLLMPWRAGPRWRDPSWLACAFLPTYMLHQFEEHGFDLLGRRYYFIVEMCRTLGHADLSTCPADRAFILAVNVGAVWIAGALAIAFARKNPLVGTCAFGVCIVNAIAHIAPAIIHGAYNPGVLSSVVLFVPLSYYVVRTLDRRRLAAVVLSGVILHAVLIAGVLAYSHGYISHAVNLVVQFANGLVPLLIATWAAPHSALGSAPVAADRHHQL